MDCKYIMTEFGKFVARITIINFYGNIVLDTLINPNIKVTDYQEHTTGIKSADLIGAPSWP